MKIHLKLSANYYKLRARLLYRSSSRTGPLVNTSCIVYYYAPCRLYKKDFFQIFCKIGLILLQGMASLCYLLCLQFLSESVIGKPQIAPEQFLNRLNISYGINYKYNGQQNYNINGIWEVTKVKILRYEDIKFPNISFDPEWIF